MTPLQSDQPGATNVAVLHRAAGRVRGLVAATGIGRPKITAWREFDTDQIDAVGPWLESLNVSGVIGVLPAAAVICRTCTLPEADPQQLDQALSLQAEANFPTAGAHRLAHAVLPAAAGETSRSGIIVAWPETAAFELSRISQPITFTPDVVALAALFNGARPTEALLWLDAGNGSVAVALAHANGVVLRAARGNASTAESWAESVRGILAETALNVGHTAAFTESLAGDAADRLRQIAHPSGAFFGPTETLVALQTRIEAPAAAETAWWRDYAVAVGALLAAHGPLAPLTRLRTSAPLETPSRLDAIAKGLSNANTTIKVVAACLLVAMLGPLLLSGLRLGLLNLRLPESELTKQIIQARDTGIQLALYSELRDRAWPMTKILADITCNTPEAIDLDEIRIRHGEQVSVIGQAKRSKTMSAPEAVAQMQENLGLCRVFSEISTRWRDADSYGSYEFTLTATVAKPYHRHHYTELDYAAKTRAERLYGPTATGASAPTRAADREPPAPDPQTTAAIKPTDDGEERIASAVGGFDPDAAGGSAALQGRESGGRGPRPIRLDERPGSAGSVKNPAVERRSGAPIPPSHDIPEPLSPKQIDAMRLSEAREALTRVSAARQRARLDEPLRKRLKKEFKLLVEKVKELRNQESSS